MRTSAGIAIGLLLFGNLSASELRACVGAGQPHDVVYLIRETPGDPNSPITFSVKLELSAQGASGNSVGWRIEKIIFHQFCVDRRVFTVWSLAAPPVVTPDGLWWVEHQDCNVPQLAEFDVPPLLVGTAIAQIPTDPNLIYSLVGVDHQPVIPPPTPVAYLTWTFTKVGSPEPEDDGEDDPGDVMPDDPEPPVGIIAYDAYADGVINGKDCQPFVEKLIDEELTPEHLTLFVYLLMSGHGDEGAGFVDCNEDCVYDAIDLYYASSEDCNGNFVPDECEIDDSSTAPGGPWYCLADCAQDANSNGAPDECEPDCNTNGLPDDLDIAEGTSLDCDSDGVPDECGVDCNHNHVPDACDIAGPTSADCNSNGIPDECEMDCNNNDVPDDCDILGGTSEDCNSNSIPDECDLVRPLKPSLDCNANDVPDECDIAAGTSQDTNANQIPDECESQGMSGGGGGESMMSAMGGESSSSMQGEDEGGFDEEAAWNEFYMWYFEWAQTEEFAEMNGAERYEEIMAELGELGLPQVNPWADPEG